MESLIRRLDKISLARVSFLQASLQVGYVALVGILFWRGNEIFGKMNNYLGPVMFLILFIVSALISALTSFDAGFTCHLKVCFARELVL